MGLLLLLRFLCALAHALGEAWDVCVRRGGLSERGSDVVVVVRQINRDDGVSMGGGCERER